MNLILSIQDQRRLAAESKRLGFGRVEEYVMALVAATSTRYSESPAVTIATKIAQMTVNSYNATHNPKAPITFEDLYIAYSYSDCAVDDFNLLPVHTKAGCEAELINILLDDLEVGKYDLTFSVHNYQNIYTFRSLRK